MTTGLLVAFILVGLAGMLVATAIGFVLGRSWERDIGPDFNQPMEAPMRRN